MWDVARKANPLSFSRGSQHIFHIFFVMQEKTRWCENNALLRLDGKPELTLDEYKKSQNQLVQKVESEKKKIYIAIIFVWVEIGIYKETILGWPSIW